MPDPEGPWRDPPPSPPSVKRRPRFILWLALMAVAAAGVLAMARLFPGQLAAGDRSSLWYDFGLLAVVSSGLVYARQINLREAVRNIAVWIAIAVAVLLGFAYRSEILDVGLRLRGALIPAYGVAVASHTLVVDQSDDGNFYVMGEVDGISVRFLMDTGASDIVLSLADARRLGIDVGNLSFDHSYETANGAGRGADLKVAQLGVGPIRLANVPVSVNQAPMESSLLGMTFFRRLDAFEIRGTRLTLRLNEKKN
jgi:aspartyl protease family protein